MDIRDVLRYFEDAYAREIPIYCCYVLCVGCSIGFFSTYGLHIEEICQRHCRISWTSVGIFCDKHHFPLRIAWSKVSETMTNEKEKGRWWCERWQRSSYFPHFFLFFWYYFQLFSVSSFFSLPQIRKKKIQFKNVSWASLYSLSLSLSNFVCVYVCWCWYSEQNKGCPNEYKWV